MILLVYYISYRDILELGEKGREVGEGEREGGERYTLSAEP